MWKTKIEAACSELSGHHHNLIRDFSELIHVEAWVLCYLLKAKPLAHVIPSLRLASVGFIMHVLFCLFFVVNKQGSSFV